MTARERPDIALVGLGESPNHALQLISEIVKGAFCPVIALLDAYDGPWLSHAAEEGVYAYIVDSRPEELQSALDIALRRYSDFQELQGAFERRDAEALREAEHRRTQQRQVLELHEGVVQSLSAGLLALELDRQEESKEALLDALVATRAVVRGSLDELVLQGVPLQELIAGSARTA